MPSWRTPFGLLAASAVIAAAAGATRPVLEPAAASAVTVTQLRTEVGAGKCRFACHFLIS